ncbi:MAG: hypothetical protein ACTIJQ_06645 [Alcaligenes sp.]
MKILLKLAILALATGLAACQHIPPRHIPEPVGPAPPAKQGSSLPATSTASAATASRTQSTAVITLHLAQEKAETPLVAVDVGGTSLYALPQPVLTQADLLRVTPVTAQDQRAFILLEMNQRGLSKLRSVTAQAQGHYLLLSVQGQLAGVARISETISDGRLLIGTQNAQHTQAILKLMQGGQ